LVWVETLEFMAKHSLFHNISSYSLRFAICTLLRL
jgi:hypothetical protein